MSSIRNDVRSLLHRQVDSVIAEFAEAAINSDGDFGKVEEGLHAALLALRPIAMSAGIALSALSSQRTYLCPVCGDALHAWQMPERQIVTSEGEARYAPVRRRCRSCSQDYYPLEEANGLSASQFTTGAKALIATAAAHAPYGHVASWLLSERRVPVSAKEVDRTVREVSDWRVEEEELLRAGVFGHEAAELRAQGQDPIAEVPPLYPAMDTEATALISVDGAMVRSCNKGEDGKLEWFEHRAGIITGVDEASASQKIYIGAVCDADTLFDLLAAAWRQTGMLERRVEFVADGARWIWDRVGMYFPNAIQTLDVYHAAEHVGSAAAAAFGEASPRARRWQASARERLLAPGGPKRIIGALIEQLRHPDELADAVALRKELRYLLSHRHRMRYAWLLKQGLCVGSGAMESAIKQLNLLRLKLPGMKWTRTGADAVLRLRAAELSGALEPTTQRRHNHLMRAARTRYQPGELKRAA